MSNKSKISEGVSVMGKIGGLAVLFITVLIGIAHAQSGSGLTIDNQGNLGPISVNGNVTATGTVTATNLTASSTLTVAGINSANGTPGFLIPVGCIFPYAGLIDGSHPAPAGWLICDGRPLKSADYPQLFAIIGTAYGNGSKNADGTAATAGFNFNTPDYRGRFLRGTDDMSTGAASRDPNAAARTAMIATSGAGGNTGNAVGSVQGAQDNGPDQMKVVGVASDGGYWHDWTSTYTTGGGDNESTYTEYHHDWVPTYPNGPLSGSITANNWSLPIITGASQGATTTQPNSLSIHNPGNEVRPTNIYVNYIIKY